MPPKDVQYIYANEDNSKLPERKVFALALDGATFELIKPWMDSGELPNITRLYHSGVHGPLQSTYPPLTGPAWCSFMSGKRPENHGLLEFFSRKADSYRQVLGNRLNMDGRSIWRVLSDNGKKVGVLSVPLTYPPEEVNGFVVTGLLTPRTKCTYTYPAELQEELDQKLGGYKFQHVEMYVQNDPSRLFDEEWAIMNCGIDAALYLMESKPWDFFMMHVLGTDVLAHAVWHYGDPNHIDHNPKDPNQAKYGNVLLKFWRDLDVRLGQVLAKLDEKTYVMVMSDHGFGPLRKFINFNVWLLDKGYLRLKPSAWTKLRYIAFKLGYNYRTAVNFLLATGLGRNAIGMGRGKREDIQRNFFLSLDDVDWTKTTAYSMGNFGQMYVNVKGREPQGCVEPGAEYEAVMARLQADLRGLEDPDTGETVVDQMWRGSELYHGKYADRAPDIFFLTRNMQYKAMGLSDFGSNAVFEKLYATYAHHKMNGIFMLKGPGVPQDVEFTSAQLIDLAPTIYYLMGVPVPTDLDGRVLSEVVEQIAGPAQYENQQVAVDNSGSERVYTPEQEAALTEMLRNLGYVD